MQRAVECSAQQGAPGVAQLSSREAAGRVGIDLLRPQLMAQGGYIHVLVLVDYIIWYLEAIPL